MNQSMTWLFLNALLSTSSALKGSAALTFTLIHPDKRRDVPSRHITLGDERAFQQTLNAIDISNAQGWGSFAGIALRRLGLTRYQRGTLHDLVALPALFLDIDDPEPGIIDRLQVHTPGPTCIVWSGGGVHAYFQLVELTSEWQRCKSIMKGLALTFNGDILPVTQPMRLPGTFNSKPHRQQPCTLIRLDPGRTVTLDDFVQNLPSPKSNPISSRAAFTTAEHSTHNLNPRLIAAVAAHLQRSNTYTRQRDWLNGPCPTPDRHKHFDSHPSFGFHLHDGYGYCYVCGTFTLKRLCQILSIRRSDYGGLLQSTDTKV